MQIILRELIGILSNGDEPAEDLELDTFVLKLKEKKVLGRDDIDNIQHKETYTKKVDEMIEILCLKPESAYVSFMETLQQERMDLYLKAKEIQDKYNFIPSKCFSIALIFI